MAKKTYTSLSFGFGPLALSLLLSLATGCGEDGSNLDDQGFVPPPLNEGGLTTDASSVVVGGDSGTTPVGTMGGGSNDAGGSLPFDAGGSTTDSSVPAGDTGVAVPDSGAPDGGAPDAGPARGDQGMGDGKDVITIGDSWMNLNDSVGIEESLLKVSKRPYRTFGVPGTKLLDEVIPKQYTTAKSQGAVKTVIMTAGGNDVLQDVFLGPFGLAGCKDGTFNADCKKRIEEVAARMQKLWAQMAADGVTDVLLISYSNKTLGGEYKMVSAYSSEKITPLCLGVPAPLRCSAFETDMNVSFKDRGDGIHPDDATYDAIGAGVWKMMQDLGMRR